MVAVTAPAGRPWVDRLRGLRPPLLATGWALFAVPGWFIVWFVDGEYGPAGTDDWTMAEAWSGPLAGQLVALLATTWVGVVLAWALHRRYERLAHAARLVTFVASAPFLFATVVYVLAMEIILVAETVSP